ncbi:SMP-30/gluconolactonase/LRE family protein [Lysobacter korlensis]|uniref:SMP-30/gluconolactonase/LRE family protein n=1 Tax=Lysobacter korlensis TaxID=553636 RepID=A0ABV6RSZ5_9GAMM
MLERSVAEEWVAAGDSLGESPRYDRRGNAIRWIDIDTGERKAAGLAGSEVTTERFPAPLGAHEIGVRADAVAVGGSWFAIDRADGSSRRIGSLDRPGIRFNDSGVDSRGRLWSATMREDEGMTGPPLGALHLVTSEGLDPKLDGLTAGNGLGWTPADDVLYLVNSGPNHVLRIPFDPVSAALGVPDIWLDAGGEDVDGLAVDSAGGVWVAVWGAGELRRYNAEAELVAVLEVPAAQVTAACFAGPDLRTVVITTAARDQHAGTAGSLFRATVPIPGRPAPLWRGY